MATARFWGVERVLVQGDGRWSVRRWPGWAELASGDGEAEPEPDGRRLAVRTHGDAIAVLDGDARTDLAPPTGAGPLRALAWGSDGCLLLEMGRDPMNPPFGAGPTLLPVPETGCSAQPFGSYPDEGVTLWRLPTDGSPPARLAVADGASRISRPVGLRGGRATFELWRLPLYGRTYTWRILRHEASETGAGAVGDLLPGVPGATAGLAPSPDGRRLAFLHSRIEPLSAVQFHLALVGGARNAAVEYPLPDGIRLSGRPPVWAPDGAALAVTAFDGIRVGIVVVEPERGTWRWLCPTDGHYERVALAPGGAEALATWQSPSSATRLCRVSADGRAALPGVEDAAPETAARFDLVRWRVDGFDFEGVLATPPEGSGPWPLVVDLHGGPINGLRFGRQPRLERWAGAGFAAFAPEHRESGIAGEAAMLAALRCLDDPPGLSAARDVLAGVEEVVRRGAADPERLYLFGHSAGANLAGRLVTADHRFGAAVCWEGLADWQTAFGAFGGSDHIRTLLGGNPWQAPERYRAASPIARVADVRTPMLLLYGDGHGSPFHVTDAIAWYTALREHGVEAELVLYRGEGHWMLRPENQDDLYARSVAWFRRHGA